jgi:hypothetical protein
VDCDVAIPILHKPLLPLIVQSLVRLTLLERGGLVVRVKLSMFLQTLAESECRFSTLEVELFDLLMCWVGA